MSAPPEPAQPRACRRRWRCAWLGLPPVLRDRNLHTPREKTAATSAQTHDAPSQIAYRSYSRSPAPATMRGEVAKLMATFFFAACRDRCARVNIFACARAPGACSSAVGASSNIRSMQRAADPAHVFLERE